MYFCVYKQPVNKYVRKLFYTEVSARNLENIRAGRKRMISRGCYNLKWDGRGHGQGKSGKVTFDKDEREVW